MRVLCVLKSGGVYDASWVEKLWAGAYRHMPQPFTFACLSDVELPEHIERIPLEHNWPGWWSKMEMFKAGIITGPTLYLDLDTVVTGPLDEFTDLPYDFAMLRNFNNDEMVGSGVMWFKGKAPVGVYERFIQDPERVMGFYTRQRLGPYCGDQAFIWDTLERQVDKIDSPALRSYKEHCRNGLPEGTSLVAFHGRPRPTEIRPDWLVRHWQ